MRAEWTNTETCYTNKVSGKLVYQHVSHRVANSDLVISSLARCCVSGYQWSTEILECSQMVISHSLWNTSSLVHEFAHLIVDLRSVCVWKGSNNQRLLSLTDSAFPVKPPNRYPLYVACP